MIAATRGNHGQGVAMAARLHGIACVIVVPHGNSVEKNRAMIAQGAELVEHGQDFQESLEYARVLAGDRGFVMVDSFHERLVMGTATYALEFLQSAPALDRVYVPIGLGLVDLRRLGCAQCAGADRRRSLEWWHPDRRPTR